ncbi:unnamed protein product [Rotaria sordida]|uniref:snRNA-activating protein complex subunit 4 n=1 Tax=Rotaria sordida TaxID=392033 RepID=A0A814X3U9_9BILA|nr:unnamed protein product [Rotaria sordida]
MADVIKNDIEKIERALNIRVDDVEIEVALNAAFPQAISTLFDKEQIKNEQIDETPNCYDFVENLNSNPHRIDHSSLLTFATALNLCYQRNLFQFSKHCQSIDTSNKSNQSINEILPIQNFDIDSNYVSNHLTTNNESIQNIRRMMQREEKARLSSNETIEKLIESVARSIRQNKEHELIRRIEILQTSTRDSNIVNEELQTAKNMLDDLRILSSRELIQQRNINSSIDWTNISEIFMNNQYTEKHCRHAWQQLCLPVISYNQNWSSEEDQLLINTVQIYGAYADQWERIALNFPQRSPYMCANRYMFLENTRLNKIKFSKDQINELKQVIEGYRHKNYVPLNKIAYKLGYSLSTVRREWRNIDPNVRRGPWQVDEDEALLRSVVKQSNRGTINWNLVACDVPGRSQTKCYHRYIHLTRKYLKTEFQPKDDQLLIEQHQLKNARWSQIQPLFPGRSCYTLQNRWRKLIQYRQINELFTSQQLNVQLFILKQFPAKTTVTPSYNNLYHAPNFQLTYDQLQCLTSNSLFKQFCNEIDLHSVINRIGIRQFLNKLSTSTNIQQIKQLFFSLKRTRQKQLK